MVFEWRNDKVSLNGLTQKSTVKKCEYKFEAAKTRI